MRRALRYIVLHTIYYKVPLTVGLTWSLSLSFYTQSSVPDSQLPQGTPSVTLCCSTANIMIFLSYAHANITEYNYYVYRQEHIEPMK